MNGIRRLRAVERRWCLSVLGSSCLLCTMPAYFPGHGKTIGWRRRAVGSTLMAGEQDSRDILTFPVVSPVVEPRHNADYPGPS